MSQSTQPSGTILTDADLLALREFATANGSQWRRRLRAIWDTGTDTEWQRRLRNVVGPRGLAFLKPLG